MSNYYNKVQERVLTVMKHIYITTEASQSLKILNIMRAQSKKLCKKLFKASTINDSRFLYFKEYNSKIDKKYFIEKKSKKSIKKQMSYKVKKSSEPRKSYNDGLDRIMNLLCAIHINKLISSEDVRPCLEGKTTAEGNGDSKGGNTSFINNIGEKIVAKQLVQSGVINLEELDENALKQILDTHKEITENKNIPVYPEASFYMKYYKLLNGGYLKWDYQRHLLNFGGPDVFYQTDAVHLGNPICKEDTKKYFKFEKIGKKGTIYIFDFKLGRYTSHIADLLLFAKLDGSKDHRIFFEKVFTQGFTDLISTSYTHCFRCEGTGSEDISKKLAKKYYSYANTEKADAKDIAKCKNNRQDVIGKGINGFNSADNATRNMPGFQKAMCQLMEDHEKILRYTTIEEERKRANLTQDMISYTLNGITAQKLSVRPGRTEVYNIKSAEDKLARYKDASKYKTKYSLYKLHPSLTINEIFDILKPNKDDFDPKSKIKMILFMVELASFTNSLFTKHEKSQNIVCAIGSSIMISIDADRNIDIKLADLAHAYVYTPNSPKIKIKILQNFILGGVSFYIMCWSIFRSYVSYTEHDGTDHVDKTFRDCIRIFGELYDSNLYDTEPDPKDKPQWLRKFA